MKKKANTAKTILRLLGFSKKYSVLFFVTVVCAIVYVAASLIIPVFVGDAIDCAIEEGRVDFASIGKLLLKIGIATGAAALAQYIMNLVNNKIAFKSVCEMRKSAFAKLQKMPFSYIDSHQAGETVNRVISDVDQFSDGLLMGFTQFFTGVITIVGTLVFMLVMDWRIALFVCALTPLSLFVAKFIAEHTHDFFLAQSKTKAEQTAFINETVSEQKVTIAFSHGDENIKKFEDIKV